MGELKVQTFYVIIKKNYLSIYEKNQKSYERVYLRANSEFAYSVNSAKDYIEKIFPDKNIRYIAILDGVDNFQDKITNEFAPIKGVFNELFCKETSKSVKKSKRKKMLEGYYSCTVAPYGYKKDPDNPGKLIIDEIASKVVKSIFELTLQGDTAKQVADILNENKVITPSEYLKVRGLENRTKKIWTRAMITKILSNEVYTGKCIRGKTQKISYKNKKRINIRRDEQIKIENTHEAIIDADTWARVQELRKNKRRPTRTGKTNMFSGIVRCADCGEKLYYCTSRNFEARQDHFVCSTSRLKGKEVCATHFIRAVVLERGVLAHMRMTIACVANHEEQFRKAMGAKQKAEAKRELAAKRRQLTQAERRIEELDRLFKRIYEDNVGGKLSDSRFQMLSDDYEQEQEELRKKLLRLNEEITKQEEQSENIDRFISKVRKYLDLDELTPAVLNDMVKAVYVHAPDKSKGHREQQIDISYDLVGILPASLLYDLQNGETA